MLEEINDDRVDEALSDLTPLEEARKRINLALIDIKENDCPLQRFPCTLFSGCGFDLMSDSSVKIIHTLFLHLCSIQDQRRWTMKSHYKSRGRIAYRGVCSRSGKQSHNLLHCNRRTSSKCKCPAYFTLYHDGKVVFKNDHTELCLPDPDMGNDGYVFNSGLSPTKRSSIVSSITDLMSDYGTTPAVVRKQIENSLVKSGDTGFGSG